MTHPKSKLKFVGAALLGITACAPEAYHFSSLAERQPYVAEVSPAGNSGLPDGGEITLKFSQRLDLAAVGPDSVALLNNPPEGSLSPEASKLIKKIQEGDLPAVPLQYFLGPDETVLTVQPEGELPAGDYLLVVTPQLRSAEGLPFNQKPGEAPTPFTARFLRKTDPENTAGPQTPEAHSVPEFGPAPEQLVINELLYDGAVSETDGECFVELYGTPGGDIGLYQVAFVNGADGKETDRVTLPKGSRLAPDGIFLIADLKTNSSTESRVPGFDFLDHFDPQNGPDGVLLIARDGRIVDSVVYGNGAAARSAEGEELGEGAAAADAGAGHSLTRSGGRDTDDNAADFKEAARPTPGVL